MALVLPILLLVVFGAIDFGRMFFTQISLTAAAREGARASALGYPAQVAGRVSAAAQPLSGVTGSITVGCPANPGPTDSTTVTASYTFTFLTPLSAVSALLGGSGPAGTLAMTGKGVMRCGG